MSVRARKASRPRVAVKRLDARHRYGPAAPARHPEAEADEHRGRVAPEDAQPEHAHAHVGRRRLANFPPAPLALGTEVGKLPPVMQQHLQRHPFGHALGEVRADHAHDRHGGQPGLEDEMVDAGAEREDRLEIGQGGEQALRRLPDEGVAYRRRIGQVGPDMQRPVGLGGPDRRRPRRRRPWAGRQQDRALPHSGGYSATTPSGAVAISKAAASSARV